MTTWIKNAEIGKNKRNKKCGNNAKMPNKKCGNEQNRCAWSNKDYSAAIYLFHKKFPNY